MPNPKPTSTAERAAAALREQQASERRRQFAIVGAVVAVLAIIGGLAWWGISRGDTSGEAASNAPANTDGYAVVVGDADAPITMKFYEDPQCPICKAFEEQVGDQVSAAVAAGDLKVEYHVVSFLDHASENDYSSRAANALYSVADVAGVEVFKKFHDELYANQPDEGTAGPEDDELIASAVEAGAEESAVRSAIEDKVFEQWIVNATDQMSKDGVNGTPTVFIDGEKVEGTPQDAIEAVLAALK